MGLHEGAYAAGPRQPRVRHVRCVRLFRVLRIAAGDPGRGYYSFDIGNWHLIALHSNCSIVSCAPGSAQERWLRADLAASGATCTLAYWHHARFSSGTAHGSFDAVGPLWQALYDAGADLVLASHEHNYGRFAPLDPSGGVDTARGIRSFVVGTGGRNHYGFGSPLPGSELRNTGTYGACSSRSKPAPSTGCSCPRRATTFTDAGSAPCH